LATGARPWSESGIHLEEMRDIAWRVGPSFLINVASMTARYHRRFRWRALPAHAAESSSFAGRMQKVEQPFDIVVTRTAAIRWT